MKNCLVRLKDLQPGTQYYCVSGIVVNGHKLYSPVLAFETTDKYIPEGAVDLGMDLLWASCNLGASSPEETGNRYAWGELETKESFSWDNYSFIANGNEQERLYSHDVARAKLGRGWRMPTWQDYSALLRNSALEFTVCKMGEVLGLRIENKHTEQRIFLPFAGVKKDSEVYDPGYAYGAYLTSDLSFVDQSRYPYFFYFEEEAKGFRDYGFDRAFGFAVRPVFEAR